MLCSTNKVENGILKEVKKKAYATLEDAIEQARKMNISEQQVRKVVAYKWPQCHKYYVWRSKKELTDKVGSIIEMLKFLENHNKICTFFKIFVRL